jgi:acyl-CoA synthetase (AMP-forming)/AMP-acid ligase II
MNTVSQLKPKLKNNQELVNLSEPIKQALKTYSKRVLLVENDIKLCGHEIENIIELLVCQIEVQTQPNDVVGIYLPQNTRQVLSILAVFASGRIPMILKSKETLDDFADRPMSLFITSETYSRNQDLDQLNLNTIFVDYEHNVGLNFTTDFSHEKISTANLVPSGVGMVLYTSGSSGKAHGVMVPAEGSIFLANTLKKHFLLNEDTVSPVVLPLSHTMCINTHFLPTLLAGGRSVLTPASCNLNRIYRNILDVRGNVLALISDLLPYLIEEKRVRGLEASTDTRVLALSGGIITSKDIEYAKELFPNATIYKGYGLTEATRIVMISSDEEGFQNNESGYELLNEVDIEIRNNSGEVCENTVAGEIFIKSPTVMKGYYNEEINTIDNRGYFKSGDCGEITKEGRLVIHGRLDGILKVNGERISAYHIEQSAMKLEDSNEFYRTAKCISINQNKRNKLFLFLELNKSQEKDNSLIVKCIKRNLKKQFKVQIEVIEKDSFPRANNGKVLVKSLRNSITV